MQVESLNEMYPQTLHHLVFLRCLNSFGNYHRVLVVAESDHFLDQTLFDEIHIDELMSEISSLMKSGSRLAIEPRPAYPLPASSTAKRISLLPEFLQPAAKLRIVANGRALRYLEHDPAGICHVHVPFP